ncbi:endonuclease/exonuclease/phosphatase family metal-dependent hydrolase [Nonlabens xylanidelens]|uniref:Endonuclease/exonuclease/phosphatase family metal-dependent hydrolase n=2 Tax=Nonlabens xylanidelens TaxID=191564 RepID=A0A2S6IKR1_9FLAO|nr:endonuclease/exonuclease/phosphatase family metal-dependent hydrolase [Nonlabens xylanidelens]
MPNLVSAQDEIALVSWNIRDFGKTKSAEEIEQIGAILKEYDVIALQEVVSGYGGSQAVARLADYLNRTGSKWDYSISNPTKSPKYKTEKYAFLWKTSKVKVIEKAKLITDLDECVYREPYQVKLESKKGSKGSFTLLNYHSRKHSEQPEIEVSCINDYMMNHKNENIILAGDFNLTIDHNVFDKIKNDSYKACLNGNRTTLKRLCKDGNYLNHAIDNIIYNAAKNELMDCGTIDFVKECGQLESMRMLSDHLPVYMRFKSN